KCFFDEAIFVKEFKTSSTICISSVEQDGDDDDDETFRSSTENLNHTLLDGLEERNISTRLIIVHEKQDKVLEGGADIIKSQFTSRNLHTIMVPGNCKNPCHHRVVRISPTEAVVLNSTERVPYLLIVEVLEGEPNLDMSKMQAQKSLSRLLHDEKRIQHSEESTDSLGSVNKPNTERFHDKLKDTSNSNYIIGEKAIENECNSTNKSDNIKIDDNQIANILNKLLILIVDSPIQQTSLLKRMRTAAVMLAQLNAAQQMRTSSTGETIQRTKADTEAIRKKIISEMMGLEEERMLKITTQGVTSVVDERRVLIAVNKDDPSAIVFSEEWETKKERIRKSSPFGSLSNWRLLSVIVKTGADLRQERLACKLIREIQGSIRKQIFLLLLHHYQDAIVATTPVASRWHDPDTSWCRRFLEESKKVIKRK
ncbi:31610_t:CDS:2, partial [Gigaspora margarita]